MMSKLNVTILDALSVGVEFLNGPADGRVQEVRVMNLEPVVLMKSVRDGVLQECHAYEWKGERNERGNWVYQWERAVGMHAEKLG